MDRLLLKRNTKILASISKKAEMLIHHVFIHSSIFFNWSLPSLLNRTKGQLKFPARGEELTLERVVGCCPCKAANKNCNANCQCRWRYCKEVTKLKMITRPAVRYFPHFSSKSKKYFVRKCSTFIYNPQAPPGSVKFQRDPTVTFKKKIFFGFFRTKFKIL